MLRRVLASSRYFVLIAVVGAFLAALAVLIDGGLAIVGIIIDAFTHGSFTPEGAKHLAVECIELIDLFLLGVVLYIIALGLYELFIDDRLPMPGWLEILSLEDLKERLIGVVIVLLAVTFLGYVVDWDGREPILFLGIAVGFVLFALAFILSRGFKPQTVPEKDRDEENAAVIEKTGKQDE